MFLKITFCFLLVSQSIIAQTMTPFLESITPNLIVQDVNATVNYYKDQLGFQLIASVPESGKLNWAMVQRNQVPLMFQSGESLQEDMPELKLTKGGVGTFFIRMTSIKELFNELKGKAEVVVNMRDTFYGMREFTIKDINGYYLTFAEAIK
jgi:lactoylglutathione lyase